VKDIPAQKVEKKRDWALTEGAFRHLLAWLDEGGDSAGERYLEMRRRLVAYFDRKNCPAPDDLADETLNRVARRLEEEGEITDAPPARYCYIVAKYVFLEYLRRAEHNAPSLDEPPGKLSAVTFRAPAAERSEADELDEKRLACLEDCLQKLETESREIIIEYYRGEQRAKIENRRALAASHAITVNALSIRACRIRDRLERCVGKCLSG
jgi:DNA-directed RNA polymerase specialized sigma24 family protein